MTAHYIIVKVDTTADEDRFHTNPLGFVRQAIRDVAAERELVVSEIVLQGEVDTNIYGRRTRAEYLMVDALVADTIAEAQAKAATATILSPRLGKFSGRSVPDHLRRSPEQKEQDQHRGRARRAWVVFQRYVEKYGDDFTARLVQR